LVGSQLNLQSPFKWTPASNELALARLKMVVGGVDFISDEFALSPNLQPKVAFSCPDSVGIYWNKITPASGYTVLTVGEQFLEPLESTTDTVLVFHQPVPTYFAVVPQLNATQGLRSGTINYTEQGAFCYLNFFGAIRTSISSIEVNLSLSSFYNVDRVEILKTVNGSSSIFKTSTTPELTYKFLDLTPEGGVYTYQAKLVFTNGLTLLSDPVQIVLEDPGKVILWPNPVTQEDYLNVISEGDRIFRIINQLGKVVFEKKLTVLKDELDIEFLPSGLYFYQLLNEKMVTDTGRIIKQ
jgi:hypothetical protein